MNEIKELQTREDEQQPSGYIFGKFGQLPDDDVTAAYFTFKGLNNPCKEQRTVSNCTFGAPPKPKIQLYGKLMSWIKGPRLGFGVFGDVVKAIEKTSGRIFAVKRLGIHRDVNEYNKEAIEALKSEINILKEIQHENIIKYLGSEIIDKDFCIYLEYASEGSLLNVYQEFGPFEEHIIQKYTKQILEGLTFLHSKSIVHQDLK